MIPLSTQGNKSLWYGKCRVLVMQQLICMVHEMVCRISPKSLEMFLISIRIVMGDTMQKEVRSIQMMSTRSIHPMVSSTKSNKK